MIFGHIGDSNIHFEVKVGEGEQPETEIQQVVYEWVRQYQGSISAEHGIGLIKRGYLAYSRTPEEIQLMRALNEAFDPGGILNRGRFSKYRGQADERPMLHSPTLNRKDVDSGNDGVFRPKANARVGW